MIISHKHKFIFIKVPKTASTSVELYLSLFCGPQDIITKETTRDVKKLRTKTPQNYRGFFNPLPDFRFCNNRFFLKNTGRFMLGFKYYDHIPAELVLARIGKKTWNSYFKFCFERNPWDKAVSAFYWRKRLNKKGEQNFNMFINQQRFPSHYDLYCVDQCPDMDFIGRYENLSSDMESVCEKIGIPFDPNKFPRTKAHTRPNVSWRNMYTPELARIVAKVCHREIKEFGYTFDR